MSSDLGPEPIIEPGDGPVELHDRPTADLPPDEQLGAPEGVAAVTLTTAGQGLSQKPLSPGLLAWRRFRRHKLALLSAALLVVCAILVMFPGLLTSEDPLRASPGSPSKATAPSGAHPLGTSDLGLDQLARILYGGRVSLLVGLSVALAAGVIGVFVGAIAGYYRGWLDNLLMRVTDLFLAIPLLVVLIVMSALPNRQAWARTILGQGGSVRSVITLLSLFLWMPMARIVRGQVLSLKEKEFVEAARAIGARDGRILWRHLVPNCLGPIVVSVTLSVAAAILLEATLSFLGFGISAKTAPTWGYMISTGKSSYDIAPWLVLGPGLAIFIVVLCVNYLGDGLRDALDPKQRKIG